MWADLRCQGDGWIIIDNETDISTIAKLPAQKQPTSCQLPGAIESGNIEFGFAAVQQLAPSGCAKTPDAQRRKYSFARFRYGIFNPWSNENIIKQVINMQTQEITELIRINGQNSETTRI